MTVDPNRFDLAELMSAHLERAEPDLLRDLLRTFVQTLMSADADAACGAVGDLLVDHPEWATKDNAQAR